MGSGLWGADGDSNDAGYDANYGGLIAGIDGMVSDDVTIGAFGSYSFSSVDGDGAGNSELEANTFGFGVYAGYAGEGFYLDGFAAYAMSQNDLSRQDILNRTITADYDASQFSVGLAGGVPIEMSSSIFITPNASLTWNHYDADTYTETGSPLAQTVNPDAVSNLTGVRRQGFWNQEQLKLRESLAHLVGLIMQRAVGDASVALRVSFV